MPSESVELATINSESSHARLLDEVLGSRTIPSLDDPEEVQEKFNEEISKLKHLDELEEEDFEYIKWIGNGSYGDVKEAWWKSRRKMVAIKFTDRKHSELETYNDIIGKCLEKEQLNTRIVNVYGYYISTKINASFPGSIPVQSRRGPGGHPWTNQWKCC